MGVLAFMFGLVLYSGLLVLAILGVIGIRLFETARGRGHWMRGSRAVTGERGRQPH